MGLIILQKPAFQHTFLNISRQSEHQTGRILRARQSSADIFTLAQPVSNA